MDETRDEKGKAGLLAVNTRGNYVDFLPAPAPKTDPAYDTRRRRGDPSDPRKVGVGRRPEGRYARNASTLPREPKYLEPAYLPIGSLAYALKKGTSPVRSPTRAHKLSENEKYARRALDTSNDSLTDKSPPAFAREEGGGGGHGGGSAVSSRSRLAAGARASVRSRPPSYYDKVKKKLRISEKDKKKILKFFTQRNQQNDDYFAEQFLKFYYHLKKNLERHENRIFQAKVPVEEGSDTFYEVNVNILESDLRDFVHFAKKIIDSALKALGGSNALSTSVPTGHIADAKRLISKICDQTQRTSHVPRVGVGGLYSAASSFGSESLSPPPSQGAGAYAAPSSRGVGAGASAVSPSAVTTASRAAELPSTPEPSAQFLASSPSTPPLSAAVTGVTSLSTAASTGMTPITPGLLNAKEGCYRLSLVFSGYNFRFKRNGDDITDDKDIFFEVSGSQNEGETQLVIDAEDFTVKDDEEVVDDEVDYSLKENIIKGLQIVRFKINRNKVDDDRSISSAADDSVDEEEVVFYMVFRNGRQPNKRDPFFNAIGFDSGDGVISFKPQHEIHRSDLAYVDPDIDRSFDFEGALEGALMYLRLLEIEKRIKDLLEEAESLGVKNEYFRERLGKINAPLEDGSAALEDDSATTEHNPYSSSFVNSTYASSGCRRKLDFSSFSNEEEDMGVLLYRIIQENEEVMLDLENAVREQKLVKDAPTNIQKIFRGYKGRKEQKEQKAAATKIQAIARMHQARAKYLKTKAATNIQKIFRGYKVRKEQKKQEAAAKKIQASYKIYRDNSNKSLPQPPRECGGGGGGHDSSLAIFSPVSPDTFRLLGQENREALPELMEMLNETKPLPHTSQKARPRDPIDLVIKFIKSNQKRLQERLETGAEMPGGDLEKIHKLFEFLDLVRSLAVTFKKDGTKIDDSEQIFMNRGTLEVKSEAADGFVEVSELNDVLNLIFKKYRELYKEFKLLRRLRDKDDKSECNTKFKEVRSRLTKLAKQRFPFVQFNRGNNILGIGDSKSFLEVFYNFCNSVPIGVETPLPDTRQLKTRIKKSNTLEEVKEIIGDPRAMSQICSLLGVAEVTAASEAVSAGVPAAPPHSPATHATSTPSTTPHATGPSASLADAPRAP